MNHVKPTKGPEGKFEKLTTALENSLKAPTFGFFLKTQTYAEVSLYCLRMALILLFCYI